MPMCCSTNRCSCTLTAVIVSLILGIVAAFLQITAVFTITPVFLWVALGIAVGFLALLTLSDSRGERCPGKCAILAVQLTGILGTILFASLLLAIGIVATSVLTALLTGLVVFFLALTLMGAACHILCRANCTN